MTGIKRKTNNNQINKIIASTATLHSLEPLANMLPNSLELNCQTYWIDGVGIWLDLLMIRTYVRKFWYQSPGLWIIQVTKDSHYNMQRQPELNKLKTQQSNYKLGIFKAVSGSQSPYLYLIKKA